MYVVMATCKEGTKGCWFVALAKADMTSHVVRSENGEKTNGEGEDGILGIQTLPWIRSAMTP